MWAQRHWKHKEYRILTLITRPEIIGHHTPHDDFDIFRVWLTCTSIYLRLAYLVICRVACLKNIESSPHIALGQFQESFHATGHNLDPILRKPLIRASTNEYMNLPFRSNNLLNPPPHLCHRQRREPESRAPTLYSRRNLPHIVTYNTKSHILRILLDYSSKGSLSSLSHHIRLVEYDELVRRWEECTHFGELFYTIANYVYASVVWGVELNEEEKECVSSGIMRNEEKNRMEHTSRICFL